MFDTPIISIVLAQGIYTTSQTFVLTISLICLAAVTIHAIGQIAAYLRKSPTPDQPKPIDNNASKQSVEDELRLIAILTAAATATIGKRVAVKRITFINQNTVSGWAEAGRQSIHYSHNIRR